CRKFPETISRFLPERPVSIRRSPHLPGDDPRVGSHRVLDRRGRAPRMLFACADRLTARLDRAGLLRLPALAQAAAASEATARAAALACDPSRAESLPCDLSAAAT